MSINFCIGCGKKHDDWAWKYTDYEVETKKGKETRSGYFCREFFKPSRTDWSPQRVKDERIKLAKDIEQPFVNGEVNKRFAEMYKDEPTKLKTAYDKKQLTKLGRKDLTNV